MIDSKKINLSPFLFSLTILDSLEFSRGEWNLFSHRRPAGISKLEEETLVIRINECRAFISLLKGRFECAKEGRGERGGRETKEKTERKTEKEKEVDQSSRWKAMPVNESP